jgi:3-dehydroquinate dehydratase / shikimate dehydrogenase
MPLVCLSLTGRTLAGDLAVLDRYRGKVDIAELRADLLDPSEIFDLRGFPERAGIPCILAVRRVSDGGGFSEGEGARLVILAKALAYARPDQNANFAYVDLESDFRVSSVEEAARTFGTRIIRSRHDMAGLPADLDAAWAELAAEQGEIPKLAVTPRGAADFARLVSWASTLPPGERIIVGMGEYGLPSRVLAERLGSSIAYTSALYAGLPVAAPGHLDPAALEGQFRFREIGRDTEVYALAGGRRVASSKSPALHNAAFRAAGIDAVYVPMPADDAPSLFAALEATGARGAAITVPLKETILPLLAKRSATVDEIGVCNTLAREGNGWSGYNTDAAGFERSLLEFLKIKDLRGLRATIVGAGGVAKTAAYVLAKLGATALILNRTLPEARELARRYGFAFGPMAEHASSLVADHSDVIVQATSMGMEGEAPGDPLDWYEFTGREAVFEIIYRPEETVFLKRARAAGCQATNGWQMLRYQSAAQFKIWTGREPPESYFS